MTKRYTKFLTPRDTEIINLMRYGLSNPEIAEKLFVQEKTIKWHLTHIYKALDIHSHRQLMALIIAQRPAPEELIVSYHDGEKARLSVAPRT